MPCIISDVKAPERGTFGITVQLTSKQFGTAIIPESLNWTLTRLDGTIVNNREEVSVTPASSVTLTLTDDDLAIFANDRYTRIVTLQGLYNSNLGTDLPLIDEIYFEITPMQIWREEG